MRRGTLNGGAVLDEATEFRLDSNQLELLTKLNELATGGKKGTQLTADRDIKYHDSSVILIPEGMTMEQLQVVAKKKAEELNKIHEFSRVFAYRPDDGAHAATQVIHRMFGMTVGVDTKTMFGSIPPRFRTIHVAHNRTMEVPWGKLEIAALPGAVVEFDAGRDKSGLVFVISVESPKKHADKIESFFNAVSDELRLNSIYRGRALEVDNDGSLKFLNIDSFNPSQIVFSTEVRRHIAAGVFGLIRHTDASRRANLSTKRAVLAFGPFGTGKTSLGWMTAQECVENGWTFIKVNAKDIEALRQAVQTAALYGPAVLFVEDIDRYTPKSTDVDAMSELLEIFDGVDAKSKKLLMVMTTNHIERIPPGMLRPGRLDYVVEIAGLDRQGTEDLIRAVVPAEMLDADIDFDAVYAEMSDWEPAWIKGAASRATELALARLGGSLAFKLDTSDLVLSARSYATQLELMNAALEGTPVNKLDETLSEVVSAAARKAVDGMKVCDDDDGYVRYELKSNAA